MTSSLQMNVFFRNAKDHLLQMLEDLNQQNLRASLKINTQISKVTFIIQARKQENLRKVVKDDLDHSYHRNSQKFLTSACVSMHVFVCVRVHMQ